MIKTIDTDVITDEMLYAGVYAAERCSDAGITDLKDVIYDAIFAALKAAPAVEPDVLNTCLSNAKQEPAQSVPFAYMRVMVGCRAPDDCEEYLDVCNPDDVGIDGKAFPVYKVPPAIDDAPRQKAIARDLIALAQAPAVEPAQSAAEPVASSFAPHMRFITNDELTEFQERNRARLEKSRLIDSPPTVPPAIDDETKRMALDFVRWIASLKIGGFIEARANDLLRLLEAGNGE